MSVGIYKLNFIGTTEAYIGQSVNIEKRYLQHISKLNNGTASTKLQRAFNVYGRPSLEILVECSISELDELEDLAIELFNTANTGLNTYSSANQAPYGSGTEAGNSKYTKEQILSILVYISNNIDTTINDCCAMHNICPTTVRNIIRGTSHVWVTADYPDLIEKIVRRDSKSINRAVVSNKLSASSRGITYPKIKSPEGEVFEVTNAYAFAKSLNLAPNHFQEVLNGKRKSHKGWRLA